MKVLPILFFLFASPAHALVHAPWPEAGVEPDITSHWMHTMEASLHPGPSVAAGHSLSTWLGWLAAFLFFWYLLSLHLKMKRREQFLLRGGERDIVLIPPSRTGSKKSPK